MAPATPFALLTLLAATALGNDAPTDPAVPAPQPEPATPVAEAPRQPSAATPVLVGPWQRFQEQREAEYAAAIEASAQGSGRAGAPYDFEMGKGWELELGGQIRVRGAAEKNKTFGARTPDGNTYGLSRILAHAEVRHESGWRAHFEGIDARIYGNEYPPLGTDRNTADIRNLYVGFDNERTSARVGRTDLKYGAQRLISPLDWSNTRRTFEGGVVSQRLGEDNSAKIDAFITRPVVVDDRDPDRSDHSRWFSGLYSTFDVSEETGIDVYGLALNEETKGKAIDSSGRPGTFDVYTVGFRAAHDNGAFDAELEAAHQFGRSSGDNIRAGMFAASTGYTFNETTFTPRFGFDVDWASGDDDPTDSTNETFNQLFPLGHAWLGRLDLVGRQNIIAYNANMTLDLDEKTQLWIAFHDFSLEEKQDSLYNAGGAATLTDPTGVAGSDVGQEWDITVGRKLDDWLGFIDHVLIGYSYFSADRFIQSQASNSPTTLGYLQLTSNF